MNDEETKQALEHDAAVPREQKQGTCVHGRPGGAFCPHCHSIPPSTAEPYIPPTVTFVGKVEQKPYCCPVCIGRGAVTTGFYLGGSTNMSTSGNPTEQCRSCGGGGVLWR